MPKRDTNAGFKQVRVREHVLTMLAAYAAELSEEECFLPMGEARGGRVSLGEAIEAAINRARAHTKKPAPRSGRAKK